MLPDLIRDRRHQSKSPSDTVRSANSLQGDLDAERPRSENIAEATAPKVERVYNELWRSGPASFAFATHGKLDHSEDTITIALNIFDHIIQPENWNPELSNNKLSASCFFFASKLTGKKVKASEVAGSIWMDPSVVAGMSQVSEGPLYDRMLESLTVSATQVVQGYEILYEQSEGLRDLLGEYGGGLASLPLPAEEKLLLQSEDAEGPYTSQVAAEMMRLGYQRGRGSTGNIAGALERGDDLGKADDVARLGTPPAEETVGEAELDPVDDWNDLDTFVADNE